MKPRPLPPDCVDVDFTGASSEALFTLLERGYGGPLDPVAFLEAIRHEVREHGATHNQRTLLRRAWARCVIRKADRGG